MKQLFALVLFVMCLGLMPNKAKADGSDPLPLCTSGTCINMTFLTSSCTDISGVATMRATWQSSTGIRHSESISRTGGQCVTQQFLMSNVRVDSTCQVWQEITPYKYIRTDMQNNLISGAWNVANFHDSGGGHK